MYASALKEEPSPSDTMLNGAASFYDLPLRTARNQRVFKLPRGLLADKTIALLFTANWCLCCDHFTETFKKVDTKAFVVLAISFDSDIENYNTCLRKGYRHWIWLAFGEETRSQLKDRYNIYGVPALLIVDEAGEEVVKTARVEVEKAMNRNALFLSSFAKQLLSDWQNKVSYHAAQTRLKRLGPQTPFFSSLM